MIKHKNITKGLIEKANLCQKFVLNNCPKATVTIRDYSKYAIVCNGSKPIIESKDNSFDTIVYNRNKNCFQACDYNRITKTVNTARDIDLTSKNCDKNTSIEWSINRASTENIEKYKPGTIKGLIKLIDYMKNLVDWDTILTRVTIWDDGTYILRLYTPYENDSIETSDSWYRAEYEWNTEYLNRFYCEGELFHTKLEKEELIGEEKMRETVDYIEEFTFRDSIHLGMTTPPEEIIQMKKHAFRENKLKLMLDID